jgi:hypothetical protein
VKAGQLYGPGSVQQAAAWGEVGIRTGAALTAPAAEVPADGLAVLTQRIEALSEQIQRLSTEIAALKG